ncbi:MAG: crotonase/enoyl-CoA hydratase family protein [Pseudomonadota bacterium]
MTVPVQVQEHSNHVAISMDDGKANALSFAMFDGLNAGLDAAASAEKSVLITGRPGKFSAGFDLSVMSGGGDDMMRLLRTGAELSTRLLAFETPVVLGISGHAIAMGALLCLSADYRVGITGPYKLGLNEVAIGMTLPWFGVELAQSRLDETHLSRAVGLAHIYDPVTAVVAGFLDEAVAEDALQARLDALLDHFATLDMAAHRSTKARLREGFLGRLEHALARDFGETA